jgi:formate/nitrite transporter FocA (FNT family)
MTLTTSTNHFSIWSVVVTPEQKLSLTLVFGSIIGGCLIIGLFILYLIKKKDRFNKQDVLH